MENLKYLNRKPDYHYLKQKSKIAIRVASKGGWKATNFKDKEVVHLIFRKLEEEKSRKDTASDITSHLGFRNMVKGVLLRRGRSTSNKEPIYYSHMSSLRNIQGVIPKSIHEGIKDILDNFLKIINQYNCM